MKNIQKIMHPMSQALIYESLHLGNKGINREQLVLTIPYRLDVEMFEQAWRFCFMKHPAILAHQNPRTSTTTFELGANGHKFFELIDAPNYTEQDLQATLLLDRNQNNPADAETITVKLIRLGEDNFQCLWCFHHAQLDGRSITIVIKDVFDTYERLTKGEQLPPPSPDTCYIDYLEQVATIDHSNATEYWQQHLAGYGGALKPEIFDSSTTADRYKKAEAIATLAIEPLHSLAKTSSCRVNNIFQVAWAILIARYCDTQDVVFGAVRACRSTSSEDYWGTVGMFMNIVPQRFTVDETLSIDQLLHAAREQQTAHKPFENTPLPLIAQATKIPTTDLLGSLLMYSEQPLDQHFSTSEQWQACSAQLFEQSSFPLELIVYAGQTVDIKIEGDASLYSHKTLDSMLASLLYIIRQMTASPAQLAKQIDLIPASSVNSFIFQHHPPLTSSRPTSFLKKIECVFKQSGHRLAMTEGEEQFSYERIDVLSQNVATNLYANGLKKGDIVALDLGRSAKSIIAQLGILRAGGTFLNINSLDPADRTSFILEDSRAKYLLSNAAKSISVLPTACRHITIDKLCEHVAYDSRYTVTIADSDIAYIIYTSGTTGKPKGVAISHGNLSNHVTAIKTPYGLTKDDNVLQFAAHTFDVAIEEIFLSLACTAHIIIRDEFCISSANSFIDFITEHNISVLNIPTAFWHFLVERMGGKNWPSALRLLIVGGEEPTLAALKKWRRQNTQHIRWINAYGPTETTITSTIFEDNPEKPLKAGAPIPIGVPLQNVTHYILDSRKKPVPLGCPGELHIGGFGVAAGYLNRPELNQEKFLADPYTPGLKMYASGDKAYLKADGNFVYLGRSDTQVKVRGFRVELGEIENTCLQHPQILGCIAEKAKDADSLSIYIISSHEHIAQEIIPFLKERLPSYAVPSRVKVVEDIPLTSSGKLSRKNLNELKLINDTKVKSDELIPPRDDIEQKLLAIWNENLPDAINGVNQSFFEAGGHSLLAVQVFSDIEDEFDASIDIRRFFGEPTIAWLASELRTQQKTNRSAHATVKPSETENQASVITLQGEGSGVPIYCICGIEIYRSFAASLGTEQPVYGVFLPIEAQMIERFSQGKNFQLPSVAEMAQSYVDAIISHTPEGPVALAGVSFGGLLAFEIAQQLKVKGREIAHLTLMESFLARAMQRKGTLEWAIEHAIYYLKSPKLIAAFVLSSLNSLCIKKSQLGIHSMDDIANADFGELRWRAYHHAANKYDAEIRPYDGSITLFKAEKQPPRLGLYVDSTYGWANLVKGELEVFTVPGDHLGVLNQPNVGVLARKLTPRIRSANQLNIRL